MKIMVFDVPAEEGGALTILRQYYDEAIKNIDHEWIFIISTPVLEEAENVKIINFPWIKKSWAHRMYFDYCVAHKLVQKYKPNEILSLQNMLISGVDVKQSLYIHQALPFSKKRYKISENYKIWMYQNIIGKKIFKSIKKADKVIIQTKWMKDACLKNIQTDSNKFEIQQPDIKIKVEKYYNSTNISNIEFFYPANGMDYKNHKVIVMAVRELIKQEIKNFNVIFTLRGDETKYIEKIYDFVQKEKLPIHFIGKITMDEVYEYYSRSILVFPSFIESFGLPLLEAKMHQAPILAADCPFAHEILDKYENVEFFDPFKTLDLVNKLKSFCI